MAGKSVEKTNGGCPATLELWGTGNPSQARVPAIDQTGDLCARSLVELLPIEDLRPCRRASTWPIVFSPDLAGHPMPRTEFPEWIKKIQPCKPSMMQSLPTSGSCQSVEPITMAHVLPSNRQLDIRSPAGQNTIQKLDQQPYTDPQPRPAPAPAPAPAPHPQRKRKKAKNGEPSTPAEPRRLRRLYEACARCRSRRIKVSFGHNMILPPLDHWHVVGSPPRSIVCPTHSEYPS